MARAATTSDAFNAVAQPRRREILNFEGRSQLIVYHFMFGPQWEEGCPSCSILGDHMDGSVMHLANRDVTLMAISRRAACKKLNRSRGAWDGDVGGGRHSETSSIAITCCGGEPRVK